MEINLTPHQVTDLATHFVGMVDTLTKFYENPANQKGYREWYLKKFGREPSDEVTV